MNRLAEDGIKQHIRRQRQSESDFLLNIVPVSYTHLDVYKRQPHTVKLDEYLFRPVFVLQFFQIISCQFFLLFHIHQNRVDVYKRQIFPF